MQACCISCCQNGTSSNCTNIVEDTSAIMKRQIASRLFCQMQTWVLLTFRCTQLPSRRAPTGKKCPRALAKDCVRATPTCWPPAVPLLLLLLHSRICSIHSPKAASRFLFTSWCASWLNAHHHSKQSLDEIPGTWCNTQASNVAHSSHCCNWKASRCYWCYWCYWYG